MGSVAVAVRPRTRTRVRDVPSVAIPQVPKFDGEDALDANKEAESFLSRFSKSVHDGNWQAFAELFADESVWKESLSLTFDKRTLTGKDAVVHAWKTLAPAKQPSDFALTTKDNPEIALEPGFVRMAPTMATLDVPFTFKTKNPDALSAGLAKLIPVDGSWKIWILSTAMRSLDRHPFKSLPRQPLLAVNEKQRGHSKAQGLPHVDGVLDAVVIGGSTSGLANLIMLESIGAKTVCFTQEPEVGYQWTQGRYESLMTHNPRGVMQLPFFPFPAEGYDEILDAPQLQRYYQSAVEELKLPLFAGVRVVRNEWDEKAGRWHITARDVATGEEKTYDAVNIVMSTGWVFSSDSPKWPRLENRHLFRGPVQHTVDYRTAAPFSGKDVVVVGVGASGHDVAHDLVDGGAGTVTLIQRSPSVLLQYDVASSVQFGYYLQGEKPVDTIDFLELNMPLGVLRDMVGPMFVGLIASQEELTGQLEAKGYMPNRNPCFLTLVYDQKGQGLYSDQPKTFPLVLEGRIKIERGEVTGLTENGVVLRDKDTGKDRVVPAGGVVFATGYESADLNKRYAETGFFDARTASALENVSLAGVDDEGEMVGYATYSGHPNLYFSGVNGSITRYTVSHAPCPDVSGANGSLIRYCPVTICGHPGHGER